MISATGVGTINSWITSHTQSSSYICERQSARMSVITPRLTLMEGLTDPSPTLDYFLTPFVQLIAFSGVWVYFYLIFSPADDTKLIDSMVHPYCNHTITCFTAIKIRFGQRYLSCYYCMALTHTHYEMLMIAQWIGNINNCPFLLRTQYVYRWGVEKPSNTSQTWLVSLFEWCK